MVTAERNITTLKNRISIELRSTKSKEQFLSKIEKALSSSTPVKKWGENIFSITVRGFLLICLFNRSVKNIEIIALGKENIIYLSLPREGGFYYRFAAILEQLKVVSVCFEEMMGDIKKVLGETS